LKQRILAAALVAAFAPTLSQAQVAASSTTVRPLVGMMGTFGGDKLADVVFTDGTSSSVTAGGTVYLYGGAEVRPANFPLSFVGTVGYHVSSAGGSNGDFRFERIPLELLGVFDAIPNRLRFGAGVRYDTNVNLSSHGVVAGPAVTFQDAAGTVVQVEWLVTPHLGIVGRYVGISYRFDDGAGATGHVDGSHGGIGVNWYFM
jgi:hypothetical protein